MKRTGPLVTVAAGAVVAAVLMVLNINSGPAADELPAQAAKTTSAPAATTVSPTTRAAAGQVTFAAEVTEGEATLAIAITNGTAVAYLCDGKKAEAWLQGSAADGTLALTGAAGASLTGTFTAAAATGEVKATGKTWHFAMKPVTKPSGLYRATAAVRGAKVVGGWIVLANGKQVGVLTIDGVPRPAPPIDPAVSSVDIDGTAVSLAPVDGSGLAPGES